VITRGLIEYDCLGLEQCAAQDVGASCPCGRRFRGETVPFPGIAQHSETRLAGAEKENCAIHAHRPRNPPRPTMADVAPEELKRRHA
jgi:hypothetical protein